MMNQAISPFIVASCSAPQRRREGRRGLSSGRTGERSIASRQVRRRGLPFRMVDDRRFEEVGKVRPGAARLASGVLQAPIPLGLI